MSEFETGLLKVAEDFVNRVLDFDPNTVTRLNGINEKLIVIEFTGIAKTVVIQSSAGKLRLSATPTELASVTIAGSPLSLLAMAKTGEPAAGDVSITGDVAIAQQLQAIVADLEIDWEEFLASLFGDVAARKMSRLGLDMARWLNRSRDILERDLADYLQIDKRIVAPADEVDGFSRHVSVVRDDVERLAMRVQRLQRRVNADK